MIIHEDLKDLLRLLNDRGVEYLVIGGYAVAFHGFIRATKDIDLLYRNTFENIGRLREALVDFGIPRHQMATPAFSEEGGILRIGVPPAQVELFNTILGVTFEQAWSNKAEGQYGGMPIFFLSKSDLIASKRAVARPQDLLDIDELGEEP